MITEIKEYISARDKVKQYENVFEMNADIFAEHLLRRLQDLYKFIDEDSYYQKLFRDSSTKISEYDKYDFKDEYLNREKEFELYIHISQLKNLVEDVFDSSNSLYNQLCQLEMMRDIKNRMKLDDCLNSEQ